MTARYRCPVCGITARAQEDALRRWVRDHMDGHAWAREVAS